VEEVPNLGKREAATARRFVAFVVERGGKFLVRQRLAGVVNAHLWEFPNVEVTANRSSSGRESAHHSPKTSKSRLTSAATMNHLQIVRTAKQFDFEFHEAKPLCTVKHSITRYRITLEAFAISLEKFSKKIDGIWKSPAQMRQLAFTAAHKKLASAAAKSIL
jgi:adenine-specific DNA glycosylase